MSAKLKISKQEIENLLIGENHIMYMGKHLKFLKNGILQEFSDAEKKYLDIGMYQVIQDNMDNISLKLITEANDKTAMPLNMQILFLPHGEELPRNAIIL